MIATFAYLVRTEARNRLRRQAGRLRKPRYALAMVIGIAYFWFAFGGSRAFDAGAGPTPGDWAALTLSRIGALLIAGYVALTWLFGRADSLAFRPAEVWFLFTGPLTPRDLLRYRPLHTQVPLAFSATLMTLVSHGAPLPWWLRLPSLWVLLSTLQLHHMAAALVNASARRQGAAGWRRNWLPITVFALAAGAILLSIRDGIAAARGAGSLTGAAGALLAALEAPVPAAILAPFRLVVAPLVVEPVAWPRAIALALLVLLAHYVWVLRSGTAFEEAAAEAGERRARALQAIRTGGGWRAYARALEGGKRRKDRLVAPPFALRAEGMPAVAIVWKNLTFAWRSIATSSPLSFAIVAAVVMGMVSGGASLDRSLENFGKLVLAFGALLVLIGPMLVRIDLRMDLRHIELLRTLPLTSPQLVGAEIAAAAIGAAALQLLVLGTGALLLVLSGQLPIPPGWFALACIGVLLVVPALATLGVTIQCAIALTFPGWVHIGAERSVGVEAMGQNILTMVGSVLLLVLLLIVPAVFAAAGAAALAAQWGPLAPLLGGLLAIAVVYGEVALAAQALGRLFDRTDPSELGVLS